MWSVLWKVALQVVASTLSVTKNSKTQSCIHVKKEYQSYRLDSSSDKKEYQSYRPDSSSDRYVSVKTNKQLFTGVDLQNIDSIAFLSQRFVSVKHNYSLV